MGSMIYSLLDVAISLFSLALLAYCIISWFYPARNKWTELLRSVVETVLTPIRRLLARHIPARWQVLDFSPIAAWLLLSILRNMMRWVLL